MITVFVLGAGGTVNASARYVNPIGAMTGTILFSGALGLTYDRVYAELTAYYVDYDYADYANIELWE